MKYIVGIFGSAFDPPTLGHQSALRQAASCCHKILLVPSIAHPFHKKMTPFSERLLLIKAFLSDLSPFPCPIYLSLLEETLFKKKPHQPVYTYDVLNAIEKQEQKINTNARCLFIRGPDNAHPDVFSKFYRFKEIEERWSLFTAKEIHPIRSRKIRHIISSSPCPPSADTLSPFLSPSVARYIIENRLYQKKQLATL